MKHTATPETCGVAIEVPDIVTTSQSFRIPKEVMPVPGANILRKPPQLLLGHLMLPCCVAPRVNALAAHAGDLVLAS